MKKKRSLIKVAEKSSRSRRESNRSRNKDNKIAHFEHPEYLLSRSFFVNGVEKKGKEGRGHGERRSTPGRRKRRGNNEKAKILVQR